MKQTNYYTNEWAYDCPYCGNTQGWTDCERDYGIVTCKNCKKEFEVKE